MERESNHLDEHGGTVTTEQMKKSFDSIVEQIDENNDLLSNTKFLEEVVDLIILLNEKHFSNPSIIKHRVFLILRDYYSNVLQHWVSNEELDEKSTSIFERISNSFLKTSSYLSEDGLSTLRELLFDSTLIDQMNRFLEDLSRNKKYVEDPRMKGIDQFFRTIQRLERIRFDHKNDSLFDNIVQCICSSTFVELFLQSVNEEEHETIGQRFFLNTCTDYVYSHSIDKQHQPSLIHIRQRLLHPFTQWISQQSANFRSWNNRILIILRQVSFLLTLSIQLDRSAVLDAKSFADYCQLIDSSIHILYSIVQSENVMNNKFTQSLIGTLTSNLYTMSLSNPVEKYLRNKRITSLILKLTKFDNDEIQVNAFKILSSITTEQDTKNILYSSSLTKSFIEFLKKLIDHSNQTLRFYNLFRSLKNIIQYEQIKEELIKQDGLSFVLHCATEAKFKPLQVQQPALEILLALTFNKDAFEQLKENLHQLKSCSSSPYPGMSDTLQYILWKLETETQLLRKPMVDDGNYRYDVFLSFSHADNHLCSRIWDQLTKDNYRVWMDQNESVPSTINEKSEIIDSSEYVLICLSDSYKENSYCRCEASYAFERQCQIIPLIVTANYRPDGWLNRVISGKISVDFTKLDLEAAMIKLKSGIDRQRKYSQIIPKKASPSIEAPPKNECPSELYQWSNENVKLFLNTRNLHLLLPICSEMDGNLLYQLYRMCSANRESMFHTLNRELSALNSATESITLLIYLRFLNEIETYIPSHLLLKHN